MTKYTFDVHTNTVHSIVAIGPERDADIDWIVNVTLDNGRAFDASVSMIFDSAEAAQAGLASYQYYNSPIETCSDAKSETATMNNRHSVEARAKRAEIQRLYTAHQSKSAYIAQAESHRHQIGRFPTPIEKAAHTDELAKTKSAYDHAVSAYEKWVGNE